MIGRRTTEAMLVLGMVMGMGTLLEWLARERVVFPCWYVESLCLCFFVLVCVCMCIGMGTLLEWLARERVVFLCWYVGFLCLCFFFCVYVYVCICMCACMIACVPLLVRSDPVSLWFVCVCMYVCMYVCMHDHRCSFAGMLSLCVAAFCV
jgi:hypothetical protein